MMHPSCLLQVEKMLAKETDDDFKDVIRNLCTHVSESLRMEDLKEKTFPFGNSVPRDCRIKQIVFHDFRTYPSMGGQTNYGIKFKKDKQDGLPSFLFIGQNGSGKSTLYSALEKIYLGTCSYSRDIGVEEKKYLTFCLQKDESLIDRAWKLEYLFESDNVAEPRILQSGQESPFAVPAFFCSDVDIENMKKFQGLYYWILEQMGYGHIEKCLSHIGRLLQTLQRQEDSLKDKITLPKEDYESLYKAILDYQKIFFKEVVLGRNGEFGQIKKPKLFSEIWKQKSGSGNISKQESNILDVNALHQEIIQQSADDKAIDLKLEKLYSILYKWVKDKKDNYWKPEILSLLKDSEKQEDLPADNESKVDDDLSLLNKAQAFFVRLQNEIVKNFIDNYGTSIIEILSYYAGHKEKYSFSPISAESLNLNIDVSLKGIFQTHPNEYFNTFRYKLYCVTLKLAIAFQWMQNYKIAVPIVIDDVFTANDFENSLKLEHFAYFIKCMYDKQVISEEFQESLQLIMMSHDDLVVTAFYRGYTGRHYSDMDRFTKVSYPIRKARIYRMEDIDEHYSSFINSDSFKNIYLYV